MIKIILSTFVFALSIAGSFAQDKSYFASKNKNPILPGHFADPSITKFDGKYYIYSTTVSKFMEPMVWVSSDLQTWEIQSLGITGEHLFWAPSVIKGDDNKFYLYYSNGYDFKCHLYIGQSPVGTWKYYGLVDQGFDLEIFRDPVTSKVYGTTSNPASRPRLVEFESNPKAVGYMTKVIREMNLEGHFFDYSEGAYLLYRNGWYYLMFSGGRCQTEDYKINYARSKNIWGPYEDAPNNPLLTKNPEKNIFGPGHHSVFSVNSQYFVVYHRQDFNHYPTCGERQICIDKMEFDNDGWIKKIQPTNEGVDFSTILPNNKPEPINLAFGKKVTSNPTTGKFNAEFAVDQNYATYWRGGGSGFLSVDLEKEYSITKIIPRFMNYDYFLLYKIMYSTDNQNWKVYYDQSNVALKAFTPIPQQAVKARYVKIDFIRGEGNATLSELEVY